MTTPRMQRIMAMAALAVAPLPMMLSCGGNATAPAAVQQVFNTAPALVISGVTATAVSAPVTVLFTFSQPVSAFPALAVTVANGTKAASTTQLSTNQYSLVVTPNANATGTMAISVAAGAFTSAAGVANTVGASVNQPFDTTTPPPPPPSTTLPVFVDGYSTGTAFAPFGGTDAVTVDTVNKYNGHNTLSVVAPASNYTGGALVTSTAQDLSGFNALTFWGKASTAVNLDLAGFGNDTTPAGSNLAVESHGIPMTTTWTKYMVPLPNAAKAKSVKGLFHFAQGGSAGTPTYWFADVQYETVTGGNVPVISSLSTSWPAPNLQIGATSQIVHGPNTIFYSAPTLPLGGLFNLGWGWFDLTADAPLVATVDAFGLITALKAGTCNITGKLGTLDIPGQAVVTVAAAAFGTPTTLPPVPAPPSGSNVISIWSSVTGGYNGTASDKSGNIQAWLTDWSAGTGGDTFAISAGGNSAAPRAYTMTSGANYVGFALVPNHQSAPNIDITHELDMSAMTHMHIDIWTPDDGTNLQFKVVDGGSDGQVNPGYNGNAVFLANSTPPLVTNAWVSYDLSLNSAGIPGWNFPLDNASSFTHLAQFLFTLPSGGTVYFDNLYFYGPNGGGGGGGGATAPTTGAGVPAVAQNAMIPLYISSSPSWDVSVDNWNPQWGGSASQITDVAAGTATVKKMDVGASTLFLGVAISSNGGDPSGTGVLNTASFPHFHVSYWTANGTSFTLTPIDAGDHETALPSGTLTTGAWTDLEIPINTPAPFDPTTIRQLKFVFPAAEVIYLDNIYFH